ncbi:MAG TPA: ATP-dependent helicase [Candidatus Limnocylindrales bacterium]|nr:ATP-dependent helicase [Candidatus Limnocylindrales bacterium]
MSHPAVAERLSKLQVDQRRAATAPPGPVLCVAPAGSGKTTTLVARIAWLIDEGAAPEQICAITFNRRAAEELRERVASALEPLGSDLAARVRIRTFHALGMEILREAGVAVEPLLDRDEILRAVRPDLTAAARRPFDTLLSRFKLDLGVDPADVERDPEAGPVARTYAAYEAEIRRRGGLDFDDLVARTLRLLETRPSVLATWHGRCAHLLVDESQDLDRAQLRMALLLAAPENRIFLVGDDDQSIYGWRLADVRRLLSLADESLPGLLRVDLETNYRCPAVVLVRAVRLVEHNVERFAKVIKAGPDAPGRLVLAPTAADDVDRAASVLRSWPEDGGSRAVLARTNLELLPVVAAALRLRMPFRAADLVLPVESPLVDDLLDTAERLARGADGPAAISVGRLPERVPRLPGRPAPVAEGDDEDPATDRRAIAEALQGWAAGYPSLAALRAAVVNARVTLAELRRDDAPLTLATAHGTKGLEFDHVAVIGLDAGRFPSARSIADAVEPERALEEERRLAYVAWTRARRSLTLTYDPGAPSQFLLEAFDAAELGVRAA